MTGYAIFDPDRHTTKSHPEYGTCEALYPDLSEEEAKKALEGFQSVNPGKTYELRSWPSGAGFGEGAGEC